MFLSILKISHIRLKYFSFRIEKYSGILDSEAEELKLKYCKFILINTNFGFINSVYKDYIKPLIEDY